MFALALAVVLVAIVVTSDSVSASMTLMNSAIVKPLISVTYRR